MTKDNLNILYLGYSGFPYGLAELQRMLLISKALVYEGASVKVIGSRGIHNREFHPNLKKIGHSQGIIYIYSSGTPFRNSSFLKRNLIKPFEKILELIVLFKLNKREKIDASIISIMNFGHLLFYKIFSLIIGFKTILNFAEYNSSMSDREEISHKINDYLFDHFAVNISDGILVISEFLIDIIKKSDPYKPYLKIPVLVDVDRYRDIVKSFNKKYFLFCGAAGYKEIVFFIINSFELLRNENTFLYLVINGNTEQLAEIKKRITISSKSKIIRLISNVTDKELSVLYKNAIGLLIPLRPTIQDWIIGKGINGSYYCPDIDDDFSIYRYGIETDYLTIILKGGIISLGLLFLIAIPAIFKGLFYSKNILSKAAGIWILLYLMNLYPSPVTQFTLNYLLVWISIGICYSLKIRYLSEEEVLNYFQPSINIED